MPRCECDGRYATGCGDHLRECEHSPTLTGRPWVCDGVTIVEMWCSDCRIAAGDDPLVVARDVDRVERAIAIAAGQQAMGDLLSGG